MPMKLSHIVGLTTVVVSCCAPVGAQQSTIDQKSEALKNATGADAIYLAETLATLMGYDPQKYQPLGYITGTKIVEGYEMAASNHEVSNQVLARGLMNFYMSKSGVKSAVQISQAADETQVRIGALQVQQNARIIEQNDRIIQLLEKLVDK